MSSNIHPSQRCAIFHWGHYPHHLDHLAPLAASVDAPLFVTEKETLQRVLELYPGVNAILLPANSFAAISRPAHYLISSLPKKWIQKLFFPIDEERWNFIFAPQGFLEGSHQMRLAKELDEDESILVYGDLMYYYLKKQGVAEERLIRFGALRHDYFAKQAPFYQAIFQEKFASSLPAHRKTLLLAPTWHEGPNWSALKECIVPLIEKLCEHFNIIVKLHPYTQEQEPLWFETFSAKIEKYKGVLLLKDFYPAMALFPNIDGLISDHSSLIYDFLPFTKPIFLLEEGETYAFSDLCFDIKSIIGANQLPELGQLAEKQKSRAALLFDPAVSPSILLHHLQQIEKHTA